MGLRISYQWNEATREVPPRRILVLTKLVLRHGATFRLTLSEYSAFTGEMLGKLHSGKYLESKLQPPSWSGEKSIGYGWEMFDAINQFCLGIDSIDAQRSFT